MASMATRVCIFRARRLLHWWTQHPGQRRWQVQLRNDSNRRDSVPLRRFRTAQAAVDWLDILHARGVPVSLVDRKSHGSCQRGES